MPVDRRIRVALEGSSASLQASLRESAGALKQFREETGAASRETKVASISGKEFERAIKDIARATAEASRTGHEYVGAIKEQSDALRGVSASSKIAQEATRALGHEAGQTRDALNEESASAKVAGDEVEKKGRKSKLTAEQQAVLREEAKRVRDALREEAAAARLASDELEKKGRKSIKTAAEQAIAREEAKRVRDALREESIAARIAAGEIEKKGKKSVLTAFQQAVLRKEASRNAKALQEEGLAAFMAARGIKDKGDASLRAALEQIVLERQAHKTADALHFEASRANSVGLSYTRLRRTIIALGVGALTVSLGPLVAAISDLGSGAVALGSELIPLTANITAVGSAAMGAVTGLGIFAVDMKGVMKAITSHGVAHEKALASLSVPARAFAVEMRREVLPIFQEIKLQTQTGLFPGIEKGIKEAMPIIKPLEQVLWDTSRAMGHIAEEAGKLLGSKAFGKDFQSVGETNRQTLFRLGTAALHFADGLIHVQKIAGPFIDHITRGIVDVSRAFDQWTHSTKGQSDLGKFFKMAEDRTRTFVGILKTAGKLLLDVGRAADKGLGHDMLLAIAKTLVTWEKWASSVKGQRFLTDFFHSAEAPLAAFAGALGALAKAWIELTVTSQPGVIAILNFVKSDVIPTLVAVAKTLSTSVLPHLLRTLSAILQLFRAVLPGLTALSPALNIASSAVTGALKALTNLIKSLPGVTKLVAAVAIGGAALGTWKLLSKLVAAIAESLGLIVKARAAGLGLTLLSDIAGPGGGGKASKGIAAKLRSIARKGGRGVASAAFDFGAGSAAGAAGGAAAKSGIVRTAAGAGRAALGAAADAIGAATGVSAGAILLPATITIVGATVADQSEKHRINSLVNRLINVDPAGLDTLKRYRAELKKLKEEASAHPSRVSPFQNEARRAEEIVAKMEHLTGTYVTAQRVVGTAWDTMSTKGKQHLSQITKVVDYTSAVIHNQLGDGTERSTTAMSMNFQRGAAAIAQAISDGTVSVKTGMKLIHDYLVNALAELGVTSAGNIGTRSHPFFQDNSGHGHGNPAAGGTSGTNVSTRGVGKERGGWIGHMGQRGRDEVHAVLGKGEFVANSDQQPTIQTALAYAHANGVVPYGNLTDLAANRNRPHHFAQGGWVTGDTDFLPIVMRDLTAMAREKHTPIFVTSGRRTLGEQAALYAKYKGSRPVAAPNSDAPHVQGIAADISPGESVFGSIAKKFGMGFTVPGEPWHIQLLSAAGQALSAFANVAPQMSRLMSGLSDSPLNDVVQGSFDGLVNVANNLLAQQTFDSGGADGANPGGGLTSAGGKYNRDMLEQLWISAGGPPGVARIAAAIALAESGGDPNAGASHPYHGLWQVGPGGSFDPFTNAQEAVGKYKAAHGFTPWTTYTGFDTPNHEKTYLRYMRAGGFADPSAHAASAPPQVPVNQITSDPNYQTPAERRRHRKKKKKKYDRLPGGPDLSGVDPATLPDGPNKTHRVNISKFISRLVKGGFKNTDDELQAVLDQIGSFDGLITDAQTNAGLISRSMDLTDEQATLTFTAPDGTSYDVVNANGMPDEHGVFVRGIAQHVAELNEYGTAQEDIITAMLNAVGIRQKDDQSVILPGMYERGVNIYNLQQAEKTAKKIQHEATKSLHLEQQKRVPWKSRFDQNKRVIEHIDHFLHVNLAGGHFRPKEKAALKEKYQRIRESYVSANTDLKSHKKDTGGDPFKVARYQESIDDQGDVISAIEGRLPTVKGSLDNFVGAHKSILTDVHALTTNTIPNARLDLAATQKEIAQWQGTAVFNDPAGTGGTDPFGLIPLLQQKLDDTLHAAALGHYQTDALGSFAQLLGQRFVGSFAKGTDYVSQTGLALVHRGESIQSDPQGAYAWQGSSGGMSTERVHVYVNGDLAPLVKHVEKVVDSRAPGVVSRELGRRARRIG